MSEEQLKAFLEKVKADAGLQEQLNGADADAVVAIAKAAGFTITTEDLNSHTQNLTEDELDSVAGGWPWPTHSGWFCRQMTTDCHP